MIPRLFAISPGDGRDPAPWLAAVADGGLRGLLVRGERQPGRWVAAARDAGFTSVFAHARDPGALDVGADGIHLPDDDRAPPPHLAWSRSTHSPAAARAALAVGAAFVALSPVWSPTSKPADRRRPLGLEGLLAAGPGPVLALGGVTPERLALLRAAGAYGAMVLGLLASSDLAEVRRIARDLGQYSP